MIISIASDTGGAGKTTIAQNEPVSLLDCDVKGCHFMGNLPSGCAFMQAQVEGKTILGYDSNNQIKQVLAGLWKKLRQEIHRLNPPGPSEATVRAARP